MSDNPYHVGNAALDVGEDTRIIHGISVSEKILNQIRNAWIAAAISGLLILISTVIMIAYPLVGTPPAWQVFQAFGVFALAFGIYKRSRICSIALLIYLVYSKTRLLSPTNIFTSYAFGVLLTFLILFYFYAFGVIGTFKYHKAMRTTRQDS